MNTRKAFGIAPLALAVALTASTSFAADETAFGTDTDQLQVGMGVICDTQGEVTRFVEMISEQEPSGALDAVNREASNPVACGLATVAFRVGKQIGDVKNGKGTYKIMEISIVAAAGGDGNWRMITPRTQFTAIRLKGYDI